ncbi:hypothetical protein [Sphingomonas sp. 2378]|uniref:hypothetical protein n=1 Tax=Sphingomonas sp. 2378 TaxID=1219748 RepID=UPI00311AF6D9
MRSDHSDLCGNARSYAVLIPDTIERENLRGMRRSAAYARRVARLFALAHRQGPEPVFLPRPTTLHASRRR